MPPLLICLECLQSMPQPLGDSVPCTAWGRYVILAPGYIPLMQRVGDSMDVEVLRGDDKVHVSLVLEASG